MEFCVYMLECADGSIYVGHTEDLEARLAAHRSRLYAGYTTKRLPVRLIFAESFDTRDDAFAAERRLKGWRRAKKLALANGDSDAVKELASIRSPQRRASAQVRADPPLPAAAHGTRTSP